LVKKSARRGGSTGASDLARKGNLSPLYKMGDEHLGERWFLMDHADNRRFLQSHDDGVRHRRDRRYALHLPGQTSFTAPRQRIPFSAFESGIARLSSEAARYVVTRRPTLTLTPDKTSTTHELAEKSFSPFMTSTSPTGPIPGRFLFQPDGSTLTKNSFAPRIATTASLPCSETTVTFTLPFWM
jgi:hypothetical protein